MVAFGHHQMDPAASTASLPFLTWSRTTGDLRVAHFFTLHALQIVPLVTIVFGKTFFGSNKSVHFWSALYTLFCIYLHHQALAGEPFLR